MEHSYIDEHSIAERYLDNGLASNEREAFERHLVDCQECTDRILLAGMFHARLHGRIQVPVQISEPARTNGSGTPRPRATSQPRPQGLVVRLKPVQVVWIVLVSLLLLLAIPILALLAVRLLGRG